MDKKKKERTIQKSARYYTKPEREEIIKEYPTSGCSKQFIYRNIPEVQMNGVIC